MEIDYIELCKQEANHLIEYCLFYNKDKCQHTCYYAIEKDKEIMYKERKRELESFVK